MSISLRRILRRLALSLSGLLMALLIVEVLLRLFDVEGLSLMQKDAALGQKYRAGVSARVYQPEAGKEIAIRINSLGFRDVEHQPGLTTSRRIVVLGDSFAAGVSVDFEKTFPRILERTLRQKSGQPWEIINLGVAGYGTAQEMIAYEEYGRRFRPEIVILCFFAGNDVSDNSSELSSNPRVYYHLDAAGRLVLEPPGRLRSGISSYLNEHSRLYLWQKNQIRKLEQFYKSSVTLNPAHRVFLEQYDDRTERAWKITFALIERLKNVLQQIGAELIVAYIPFGDEIEPDWWKESVDSSPPMQGLKWDLTKPQKLLSEFCVTNDIRTIDTRAKFQESEKTLYFKHGHFNEEGHRYFGELLAEQIISASGMLDLP